MSPPAPPKAGLVARPPLDVYKKIAIIKKKNDGIVYEDADGNLQRISDLGEAATTSAPALKPKKKLDIPVPRITVVDTYETDVPPTYEPPKSFVRHLRLTAEETDNMIEYNVDEEDETWLENHPRFGPNPPKAPPELDPETTGPEIGGAGGIGLKISGSGAKKQKKSLKSKETEAMKGETQDDVTPATQVGGPINKCGDCGGPLHKNDTESDEEEDDPDYYRRPCLSLKGFERMIDILEKATGFETIITTSQAERLIIEKMPQLLQVFGSSGGDAPNKGERKKKKNSMTVRTVINEVYNYWVQKRSKLKKPLLRKYWPVTSTNDTNPHLVFRPREKEKYKLRKKRQNDMDAYRKMKQLRKDFDKVRILLDLVRRRERINQCMVEMQLDWFEQRIYDLTDTSGLPRFSYRLDRELVDQAMDVPKVFDTKETDRGKRKKRKRGSDSRSTSPVPEPGTSGDLSAGNETVKVASTVAGENNGLPAPLYNHPLESRQSYVTEWDNVTGVPAITSYVDTHPMPTFRFRHRPRIGRGGRVVIDRYPCPGHPDVPPVNVFTVGDGLGRCGDNVEPAERLVQLLPKPLDHGRLSRRIELICAEAMNDDEEDGQDKAVPPSAAAAGSGVTEADENDGEIALVPLEDWLDTDDQLWGEERFAIGPL